jgi:signal transduction histidine kinase
MPAKPGPKRPGKPELATDGRSGEPVASPAGGAPADGHGLPARDITARKEKLITTVHDLKIPLTVSLLNLELAEMESDPAESQFYLAQVRRELEFMLETIGAMLELEKAESHGLTLNAAPLSLADLVGAVIGRMQVLLKDKPALKLINQVPPDLPRVLVDAHKITRVLNNLYANAINYAERGAITASAGLAPDGHFVRFDLRDEGKGISPERMESLFKLFAADSDSAASSGVGLLYVKRIVEAHGGTVTLTSKVDTGTTVSIALPVAR